MHADQQRMMNRLNTDEERQAYAEIIQTIERAEDEALRQSRAAHYYLEVEPSEGCTSYAQMKAKMLAKSAGIPQEDMLASLESLKEPRLRALQEMKPGKEALDRSFTASRASTLLGGLAILCLLTAIGLPWMLIPAAAFGLMAHSTKKKGKAARDFEAQQAKTTP